jgi:hypothetical protein
LKLNVLGTPFTSATCNSSSSSRQRKTQSLVCWPSLPRSTEQGCQVGSAPSNPWSSTSWAHHPPTQAAAAHPRQYA